MISEIIDNKLKTLVGEYTYAELFKELKDIFVPYTKEESLNFLRQSVYRLKRQGVVYKESQKIFNFNSGKVYEPKIKESLKKLIDQNLTSFDTSTLLHKYNVITQIPARKIIVVQKRFSPIVNDVTGSEYKYTNFEFNKNEKIFFELAKVFEELSEGETEYKIFYKILLNQGGVEKNIDFFKVYLNPKYKKRYFEFKEWVEKQRSR